MTAPYFVSDEIYAGSIIESPDPVDHGFNPGTKVEEVFTTWMSENGILLYHLVMDERGYLRIVYRNRHGEIYESINVA